MATQINSKPMSSFLGALENGSMQITSPTKIKNSPLLQAAGSTHYCKIPMLMSTSSLYIIAIITKNFFMKFSLTVRSSVISLPELAVTIG